MKFSTVLGASLANNSISILPFSVSITAFIKEAPHLLVFQVFTGSQNSNFTARTRLYLGFKFQRILLDQRPSIVVHGDDEAGLKHLNCLKSVFWTHGKIVADREHGQIDLV